MRLAPNVAAKGDRQAGSNAEGRERVTPRKRVATLKATVAGTTRDREAAAVEGRKRG